MIKKFIGGVLMMIGTVTPFLVVYSAGTLPTPVVSTTIQNPIKYGTFSEFVSKVTETAVNILIPFIVLAFVYSGFLFIKAQGNLETLKEAKSALWWSVVGAFILLGAWGFAQIIGDTVSTITAPQYL